MAILTVADNNLQLRYESGGAFTFRHIAVNATDQNMYDLGVAIGSIQEEQPNKICSVVRYHVAFQ